MSGNRNACGFDDVDPSRYHTGEMRAAERAAFEGHLGVCASCASDVAAQRRLDMLVPQLPLYRLPAAAPPRRGRRALRRVAGAGLAAAAGVAALLLARDHSRDAAGLVAEAIASDAALIDGLVRSVPGTPPRRADAAPMPWLGFVTCSKDIVPQVDGVYVCALKRESPLAREGIRAGDVLIALDGQRIRSDEAMFAFLAGRQEGEIVAATVRTSSGEARRIRVELTRRALGPRHPFDLEWSPALVASLERPVPPHEDLTRIFVPLSDTAAAHLGSRPGVLVALEPTRPAEHGSILGLLLYAFGPGGLRAGDVVTEIHGRPIRDRGDLMKALINEKPDSFTISVHRDGAPHVLRFRRGGPAPPPNASSADRPR